MRKRRRRSKMNPGELSIMRKAMRDAWKKIRSRRKLVLAVTCALLVGGCATTSATTSALQEALSAAVDGKPVCIVIGAGSCQVQGKAPSTTPTPPVGLPLGGIPQ